MGNAKEKPKSYSYWCFTCKIKVRADEVIKEQIQPKKELNITQSLKGEKKPKKGRHIIKCPFCGTKIRRNYKVWCPYCQRIVKASELILHRTIDGSTVRICRFCGL